jgi:ankyrin repeat protein
MLTTLPVELILELAGHLDVADVAALARTARVFAHILSPSLYEIIIFNPAHPALCQNAREEPGRYELSTVIETWESEFVLDYFRAKLNAILAVRDDRGRSPLHLIAESSNICLLSACLPGCGELDVRNNLGESPLHTAIESGSPDAVLRLLDAGADVLAYCLAGRSVLSFLPRDFPQSVTQVLINAVRRAGGDVNEPDNTRRRIPLHHAAFNGDEKLIRFLVDQGADVFALDVEHSPPLMYAMRCGHVKATRVLLEAMEARGYDVNGTMYVAYEYLNAARLRAASYEADLRDYGETLLHFAVRTSHPEVVQVLLDFGANPTGFDITHRTPFELAVQLLEADIVEVISRKAYSPDFWPSTGYSSRALQVEFDKNVANVNIAIVRLLLELRRSGKIILDLNHGEPGVPPMLKACRMYRDGLSDIVPFIHDVVTSVVDAGADVNARDAQGKTALHLLCLPPAAYRPEVLTEALRLFSYLLGAGADWQLQDDLGNTALHEAATWGSDAIVERILAEGAGEALHRRNDDGDTALHKAVGNKYWRIGSTKLLVDAGFDRNAVNHKGQSPAHLAVLNKSWQELGDVNAIVATDYNLRLKDDEGNPPFHCAVSTAAWGCSVDAPEEIVQFYINSGADLHDGCEKCAAQRAR